MDRAAGRDSELRSACGPVELPALPIAPSEALIPDMQGHVKVRLAAHEYPRMIEFVDALPTTTDRSPWRSAS